VKSREEKNEEKKKKGANRNGSHKLSGGNLLPSFSLSLGVNTPCMEHQGVQIMLLC